MINYSFCLEVFGIFALRLLTLYIHILTYFSLKVHGLDKSSMVLLKPVIKDRTTPLAANHLYGLLNFMSTGFLLMVMEETHLVTPYLTTTHWECQVCNFVGFVMRWIYYQHFTSFSQGSNAIVNCSQ